MLDNEDFSSLANVRSAMNAPASDLLKKAAGITSGAKNSKKEVAGKITTAKLKELAETKMPDLNASSVETAMKIIAGSARSMGIKIED